MTRPLAAVFKPLVDIGVPAEMSPEKAKYIRMTNLATYLILLVCLAYLPMCIRNSWNLVVLEILFVSALLLVTPLLNRAGRHTAATVLFGTLLNAHLVFVTVAMGTDTLLHFLIFFTASGAITLIRRELIRFTVLAVLLIAVYFGLAIVLEQAIGPLYILDESQTDTLKNFVILSIFVLAVVNASIARYGAHVTEDRLREEQSKTRELLESVRRYEEQRTAFFQNISHEFRTPLTLILGPLDEIRNGDDECTPERREELVRMMSRNCRRLLGMVNQILDLIRIESGSVAVQIEIDDVAKRIGQIVESFIPTALMRDIDLSYTWTGGELVFGFDGELLEKILSNLLTNGCKFTPEGGTITIGLEDDRPTGEIVLTVKDTGPGIPEGDLQRVFDRFYQVDGSATRRHGGTGIGLSLARDVVDLIGGSIQVSSKPGEGAEFTVRFPDLRGKTDTGNAALVTDRAITAPPGEKDPIQSETGPATSLAAHSAAPLTQDTQAGEQKRILVVEDNPDMRVFLKRGLEVEYVVNEAVNGVEGLEMVRSLEPNLVISDVMMPEMNGYDLTRAIRSDPALKLLPIILLTAKADDGMAVEGLEAGAADYITKPFTFDVLKAKVQMLIQRDDEHRAMALHDGLTGLLNRIAWMQSADRELKRLNRSRGSAALAFIDIDDFKATNDTYGHQTGDTVLKKLADLLSEELRSSDLVGRYGGEEFVVLLPESSAEMASISLHRILDMFRREAACGPGPGPTFSAGIASVSGDSSASLDDYVDRADKAMYKAKIAGKSRIVMWSPASQESDS